MGFYRTIYYVLGWEYFGSFERKQYQKQARLKFHLHRQIKNIKNQHEGILTKNGILFFI